MQNSRPQGAVRKGGVAMSAEARPRWEWRIFSAEPLTRLEPLFQRLRPANRKTDRDSYLLSRNTDANIKIRGMSLDIKIKTAESSLGAELWKPAYRCSFPPEAAAFAVISGFAGAALPPSFARGELPSGPSLVSAVTLKERTIYIVERTIIERGTVSVNGMTFFTLCAESEESAQVEYFIKGCGLKKEKATDYVTFLKSLAQWR